MIQSTIAAISTPLAVGSIGIVRLSGPEARQIVSRVFRPVGKRTPLNVKGFSAIYGRVWHGEQEIDEAVVTVYRAPRSYTGEDVAEISCHGGTYVVQQVLRAVLEEGAVPAGPGEFTKRAFLNGKMNLTEAEAVMDLISAKGGGASRAALAARDGVLSRRSREISDSLVELAAHMSAWIDYPDEDVEELDDSHLTATLKAVDSRLEALLATYDTGRVLREGVTTAIVGRPNVGKSTLMNLLAGVERSIVTDIPGTTRDVVEDVVRLGDDVVLCLADTAGIRNTEDPVETVGVQLANQRIETSDLVLAVFDGTAPLSGEDRELAQKLTGRPAVAILNKADLDQQGVFAENLALLREWVGQVVILSARTGEGAQELTAAVRKVLSLSDLDATAPILANERQRDCVRRAQASVREALSAHQAGITLDAVSVCVDDALAALMELDGRSVSETVVEKVFENFCVGK